MITVEKAAEEYANNKNLHVCGSCRKNKCDSWIICKRGFLVGAEWAEKSILEMLRDKESRHRFKIDTHSVACNWLEERLKRGK